MLGLIAGLAGSAISGGIASSNAAKARKMQLGFLNRGASELKGGAAGTTRLLELLQQTLGGQYNQLINESREVGDEQRNIMGGIISNARRRSEQLLPAASSGATMNNLTTGMSNTTAGIGAEQGAVRQAAALGAEGEMPAGQMMSQLLGNTFGRTAGLVAGKMGMQSSLGGAAAQIPMQLGQALGSLWGNVQVQPTPAPDVSWMGEWLATEPFKKETE